MYLAVVILLMFALPLVFTLRDLPSIHSSAALLLAAGRWFVFWSVGVRSATAGLRQIAQPGFTAHQIFKLEGCDALPIVSELGIANFALGFAGVLSAWRPAFVLPIALSGALFYGLAGLRHTRDTRRSFNQNVALVSDLFIAAILAAFVTVAWRR